MKCLGQEGPEIPVVGCTAHAGAWVALDGVVEVGELQRVAEEEHGGVVTHEVPVALFGVELHGKATDIAFGIGRTALARHGGEAHEALGLLTHLAEDGGTGVLSDVVCHGEGAIGACALGVHAAFGDHLAVEVGEFLNQPRVLHEDGATLACGLRVLVIGHGTSVGRGQSILFHCQKLSLGVNEWVYSSFNNGCHGLFEMRCSPLVGLLRGAYSQSVSRSATMKLLPPT